MVKLLVFAAVLAVVLISNVKGGFDDNIEDRLGTYTSYKLVAKRSYSRVKYEGCAAQKLWLYSRHGAKNPCEATLAKLKQRLPEIQTLVNKGKPEMTPSDAEKIEKWRAPRARQTEADRLSREGKKDMYKLAERMKARFPEVFPEKITNETYKLKATPEKRTMDSGTNFVKGLTTARNVRVTVEMAADSDPVLRSYKSCARYQAAVDNATSSEYQKFKSSEIFMSAVKNVSIRLGVSENDITADDVELMYKSCGYEFGRRRNAWCAAFDFETIKVMEYLSDLSLYEKSGYAHEITEQQSCATLRDLFLTFDNATAPNATLYFTNSGAVVKLITALGLYKDSQLKSAEMDDNRQWRSSKIDPFGNNLAFVSFRCGETDKVMLMHNERVVRLPACPEEDMCDLNTLKDFYKNALSNCDLKKICQIE